MRGLLAILLCAGLIQQAPPPLVPPQAPTRPPEQVAYDDASKIADASAKLEAYRKIVANYPSSGFLRQVEGSILNLLVEMPDRKAELGAAFDQVVSKIPASTSPLARLSLIEGPVTRMLDRHVVLGQAEPVVAAALAGIDVKLSATRAEAIEILARLHLEKGDTDRAAREFREALGLSPSLAVAPVALAQIEAERGDDAAALDYYLIAAAGGKLKTADEAAFRALYTRVKGADAGLEADVDRTFRTVFANPIHPEPWTPASRTNRVVLAELFTGSGCMPCVAADYALDAVLERYPASAVAVLVYHVHVPQPDPMTSPVGAARKIYYDVKGVPAFNVDGALSTIGGGPRSSALETYDIFIKSIDTALDRPAAAALDVQAVASGSKVTVSVTVSGTTADARNLRLQIALAEDELRFTGENGMRFHPLVVRALAGAPVPGQAVVMDATGKPMSEYAFGLPFAPDAGGRATLDYTFDLSLVPTEITRSLADEIAKRRKTEPAGSAPRDYKAEGHAMTVVDPAALVVVAFVQDGAKHVLQAARVSLHTAAAKTAGGR